MNTFNLKRYYYFCKNNNFLLFYLASEDDRRLSTRGLNPEDFEPEGKLCWCLKKIFKHYWMARKSQLPIFIFKLQTILKSMESIKMKKIQSDKVLSLLLNILAIETGNSYLYWQVSLHNNIDKNTEDNRNFT